MARIKYKLLLGLGLPATIGAILFLAFPLWFPWVLRPAAARYKFDYAAYDRLGYRRFALLDVHIVTGSVEFRAGRIEAFLPAPWVWRRFFNPNAANFLTVEDWTLHVSEAPRGNGSTAVAVEEAEPGSMKAASLDSLIEQTRTKLARAGAWLPRAELSNGTIILPSTRVNLERAAWNQGVLSASLDSPALGESATIAAHLPEQFPWQISARVDALDLSVNLALHGQAAPFRIEGAVQWRTNVVQLAARFSESGLLPENASVQSRSFSIPAELLSLKGYQDVTGSLALTWNNGRFLLNLSAGAEPSPGQEPALFPVAATIRAGGDTNSLQLEELTVRAPWLDAQLSDSVAFNFKGELLSGQATLVVAANLAEQPWVSASGQVRGNAVLRPGQERIPDVAFNVSGSALEYSGVRADTVQVDGSVNWPWLEVTRLDAHFAEGAAVSLTGRADLEKRAVIGGILHVEGKAGANLLPPGFSYDRVLLHANVGGPFDELAHDGSLEIDGLAAPKVSSLKVRAQWRGRAADLEAFDGAVVAGASALQFEGSATGQERAGLRLEQLTLTKTNQIVFQLEQPFSVSLHRDQQSSAGAPPEWLVALEPFQWTGEGRQLMLEGNVAWPRQGTFRLSVQAFEASAFEDFLDPAPPAARIDRLHAAGHWTNGPVEFELEAATRLESNFGLPLSGLLALKGNTNGISLEQMVIASQGDPVLSGNGSVPIILDPTNSKQMLRIEEEAPIQLNAATLPNKEFWEKVSAWTKVALTDPRLELGVSGSLKRPLGRLTAEIAAIRPEALSTNRELPQIQSLVADVSVSRADIRVDRLDFSVEGEPVKMNGLVPLGPDISVGWRQFLKLDEAVGKIEVADAQIAPFARFAPEILSPQGQLTLKIAVSPGLQLNGQAALSGAATRPLPSIGPVNNLESRVSLVGRQVDVESFTGLVGGQPFSLSGTLDFARSNPATGMPMANLRLEALNLPLARQADLILRADLDVAISGGTNEPPVVSGAVRLRDSVFLSDLGVLIPGKVAQPRSRPPYFSIDVEPLASFGVDLKVSGAEFLKVRSPFFRGTISANLTVEGTMKEPVALGEVTVDSGMVQFPFANLRVNQGLVTLTSADPYRPQLFVTAGARTLGYDIKMEVTGTADAPVLQFSSIPPLNSEQILLMLTSGEAPRQMGSDSTQQRASRLALFLGKNLLSEFSGGAGDADRLTIRSGEDISEQGKQTYGVEYRLSDDWSIVGEYDRFGEFNVGLKWRIYSR